MALWLWMCTHLLLYRTPLWYPTLVPTLAVQGLVASRHPTPQDWPFPMSHSWISTCQEPPAFVPARNVKCFREGSRCGSIASLFWATPAVTRLPSNGSTRCCTGIRMGLWVEYRGAGWYPTVAFTPLSTVINLYQSSVQEITMEHCAPLMCTFWEWLGTRHSPWYST